jgi:hypothetical protein
LNNTDSILRTKLTEYKKKYYSNQLLRGFILFLSVALSVYLLSTSVDFGFKPGNTGRSIIFFSTVSVLLISAYWLMVRPLINIYSTSGQISDEQAAQQISHLFPEVGDKLLNTIQLTKIGNTDNSLITASIEKRIEDISFFRFSTRIKYSSNNRYVKYAAYPSILLLILFLFVPQFLTESTLRIIKFNTQLSPGSYFRFIPLTAAKLAFKNEDYTVSYRLEGNITPDKIYIKSNNRKVKVLSESGLINYTFKKVQADFSFYIEANDFISEEYQVNVHNRPDIQNFNIQIQYPSYTKLKNETVSNSGNISIPEGTNANWLLKTISSEEVFLSFDSGLTQVPAKNMGQQLFSYSAKLLNNQDYTIILKNAFSNNKNDINYHIDVFKDQYPSLSIKTHRDTTLYSYMVLGGNISDDYGVSKLEIVFNTISKGDKSRQKIRNISIGKNLKSQNYFYQWILDSLQLKEGDEIEYFVRVWDNDGINGSKYTKSATFNFNLPTKQEIKEGIQKQAKGTKKKLDQTLENAKELKDQIEKIQDKLKGKKTLDWQDKKQIEKLLNQKDELQKEIDELQKQNKSFSEKKDRFSKPNEKMKEKMRQLQKLMEDILDAETKKLYDELKKLLEDQKGVDQVQKIMDQIQNKEDNAEKEIERTIELFKKLQFDQKMENIINSLDDLEKKQNELSEDTKDKSNDLDEIDEEQKNLKEEFDEIKEDIDQLEKLNEAMKDPEKLDDTSAEEEKISEEQEKSSEQLNDKQRKKSSDSQIKAGEKIKSLKKKMEDMQSSLEVMVLEENLDNLNDIVDNLIKVSFDQEKIMQEFGGVNQSDPRYVSLSQRQLKLRDDSRIIEDSLLSLAGRVFQIASFVTRELDAMNDNIESSLQALKDRKLSEALSSQQFSMTSINNLALLLNDVLQQMQQQMADAKGSGKSKKKGKKPMPGLSELQQQLNEKLENLKKGGKTGKPLSEELAKLAAQQEMIRQQLQQMQEMLNQENEGGGSNGTKEAIKKMEETEMDIVNKQITQQTIQRQKDILTRLLKAENAMRERELDQERESEKADELNKALPPQFEEYLKAKEKEVELLKTIPLKLNPYYKEEVNKYFKRLSEQ